MYWLRAGRLVLSGIPLLGAYILSLECWTAKERPFWFFATHGQSQTPPPGFLDSSLLFALIANLLTFQGWVAYLTLVAGGDLLSVNLRSLAMAAAQVDILICYRRSFISGRRSILLILFSMLWLHSFPSWVLAWSGHLLLLNAAPRPQHRMKVFFRGRLGLCDRLDQSVRLDWWRASRWQWWRLPSWIAEPIADPEEEERSLIPLYRAKVFLTVFEASGLIFFLSWCVRRSPAISYVLTRTTIFTAISSAIIVTLGSSVLIYNLVSRSIGKSSLSEQVKLMIRYSVLGQAGMLVGIYLGIYLIQWNLSRLGLLLTAAGGISTLTAFLLAFRIQPGRRRVKKDAMAMIFWTGLFSAVTIAGVAIRESAVIANISS